MDKRIKITLLVTFIVVLLGLCIIWLFTDKFIKYEKEYETNEIIFKSDEALIEKEKENMDIYFENLTGDVIVLGRKESKDVSLSLEEFANFMYKQKESEALTKLNKKDNFYYFTYDYKEGNVFYLGAMYENTHNFYIINFACQLENRSEYEEKFLKWASSVRLNTN